MDIYLSIECSLSQRWYMWFVNNTILRSKIDKNKKSQAIDAIIYGVSNNSA